TTSRHASPVTYLFRFRGPRYPPRFVSRSLRSRSRKVGGCLPGQGPCSTGDPIAGLLSRGRERDLSGSQAIRPVPLPRSRTPAESPIPRLTDGFVDAAPASFTAKASAQWKFRGYRAASAPAAYASRVVLPPPLQSSLPAGRLAFTGRELNPLDRCKRFQVHILIPLFWIYPDARRTYLHLSYSYAAPFGPALLVTQDPKQASATEILCVAGLLIRSPRQRPPAARLEIRSQVPSPF